MGTSGKRARSLQDKELRSATLLQAARDLAVENGVSEVTLTALTSRVGLHPSALRRYYESREELFLQLAEEGWGEWRRELLAALDGTSGLTAQQAAARISASLAALPLFCDLLTHVPLSLEGAVRLERARQYKLASSAANDDMAAALAQATADLDEPRARMVLAAAISIAAYLHQLAHPTPTLQQLYEEQPRWAHSALRFQSQLAELLTLTIRGAQVETTAAGDLDAEGVDHDAGAEHFA